MDRDSELELVRRLRAGDEAAFDVVHAAFNARLFRFLSRLCGRRDLAEDLLEETWVRLVTHAARLRPDTSLGPWLFTVARNLFLSHCRSREGEQHMLNAIAEGDAARQPTPFEAAAAGQLRVRLEAALAAMPVTLREVLLLVGVEGLRPLEAARVCRITPEALRQRLKRARQLLAEMLEEA